MLITTLNLSTPSDYSWRTDGCRTVNESALRTRCECDHLTSFSILMKVTDHQVSLGSSRSNAILFSVCSDQGPPCSDHLTMELHALTMELHALTMELHALTMKLHSSILWQISVQNLGSCAVDNWIHFSSWGCCRLSIKGKLPHAFMQIEWMENYFRNLTAKVWANLDNLIKSYDFSKCWLISCMPPSQVALC